MDNEDCCFEFFAESIQVADEGTHLAGRVFISCVMSCEGIDDNENWWLLKSLQGLLNFGELVPLSPRSIVLEEIIKPSSESL